MKLIRQVFLLFVVLFSSIDLVATELDEAVEYGRLLTNAVEKKEHIKYKKLSRYNEIKGFLNEQKCAGFKYKAYVVGPDEKQYFYLVASKKKNMIIGRHFKAPIVNNEVDVARFESSTKGCLDLGKIKPNVAAMSASHLQPYPNEFHVLQSNLHSLGLYIITGVGYFKIENGLIELVKKREPEPEAENVLSKDAPKDRVISLSSDEKMKAFFKAQEPYNKQALDSYHDAKKRFEQGLPKGENFFLTTRLRDDAGRIEQVFVLVKSINRGVVSGTIYNEIGLVSGFKNGQKYEFPETEIYDWLITKPDGSEEGNFVGKYLDSLNK